MMQPIAAIFNRLGPYHFARLRAAAKRGAIAAVEVVRRDTTYQWDVVKDDSAFRRFTLFPECNGQDPPAREVGPRLWSWLDQERPSVVALPGWSFAESFAALWWCAKRGIPSVLMSDSQFEDRRRIAPLEWVKKRLVRLSGAALVAGQSHVRYLEALEFPVERVFTGYDVVDNEYFAQGAESVRRESGFRSRLNLPERFFLTSCRFVPMKNVLRLLAAYARYRQAVPEAWDLVLLGDGPLATQVRSTLHQLGLEHSVHLPGFKQYDELPAYYALANAFILASVKEPWGLVVNEAMASCLPVLVSARCGCARDLVQNGRNGWTFDPHNVDELAGLMARMSQLSSEQRLAKGRASQEIVASWTPETFAAGLWGAAEAAKAAPRSSLSVPDRALLWLLMHR
jgi:glycosyltransferase involved in cell wall biosynthesis